MVLHCAPNASQWHSVDIKRTVVVVVGRYCWGYIGLVEEIPGEDGLWNEYALFIYRTGVVTLREHEMKCPLKVWMAIWQC